MRWRAEREEVCLYYGTNLSASVPRSPDGSKQPPSVRYITDRKVNYCEKF